LLPENPPDSGGFFYFRRFPDASFSAYILAGGMKNADIAPSW
jgi:hypothetical protein